MKTQYQIWQSQVRRQNAELYRANGNSGLFAEAVQFVNSVQDEEQISQTGNLPELPAV